MKSPRYISRVTHGTVALILAGGRGTRLQSLTERRAKPAVPFGGNMRIIDFTLSNCVNSGIRRIGVLTQYRAYSLIRHVQHGWSFMSGALGEYVEVIPPPQLDAGRGYAGTADAVYQNLHILRRQNADWILVLAGDHVYKMDYGPMIAHHVERGADLTIGCVTVSRASAVSFGVLDSGPDARVTAFLEKPADPPGTSTDPERSLVSMGIYVFSRTFLEQVLDRDARDPSSGHDFGADVIPRLIADRARVFAYPFGDTEGTGYWRDVGTVDAYWEANIELRNVVPPLDLYDQRWPIWTHQPQLPPAKFIFNDAYRRGAATDSLVAHGCVISGAHVARSVLFTNVRVMEYADIEDAVVLPDAVIGAGCRIRRAVIDKQVYLPPGTVVGEDPAADRERFHVTPRGIVLVSPTMLGQEYDFEPPLAGEEPGTTLPDADHG
jgi:glucose-1-phosphate adenylyltransferase